MLLRRSTRPRGILMEELFRYALEKTHIDIREQSQFKPVSIRIFNELHSISYPVVNGGSDPCDPELGVPIIHG